MSTRIHTPQRYRGRFAPTPSGPLHLGSLLTALASYLQARHHGAEWLLRIDDLDGPRNTPGAVTTILAQLDAHGLCWDRTPRYQSQHIPEYEHALQQLRMHSALFACSCTRAQLKLSALPGSDDPVYPGTCRSRRLHEAGHALRLTTADEQLCFEDGLQGRQCRHARMQIGDFVLRRADGQIGYQLACAVDESAQQIGEVIRGADLLGSTFRQLLVQRALGQAPACYGHVPVLVARDGRKLSKQNHVLALQPDQAPHNLWHCLDLLGQSPPADLRGTSVTTLIEWGVAHWQLARVPRQASLTLE